MKALIALALFAAAAVTATAAGAQRARPVTIFADPELDACPSTGRVSGLNPRGDNYLSVRAAPGANAREVARLRPGQIVWICDVSAGEAWLGVIYSNGRRNCITGRSHRTRPYTGPCPSGWVAGRYVTGIAG